MDEFHRKGKKISYFYNQEIGKFYYGKDHPMKPRRVAMAHSLIQQLGLYKQMDVYTARNATDEEMMQFHTKEYIKYLGNYVSSNYKKIFDELGYSNGFKDQVVHQDQITKEESCYNIFDPKACEVHKVNCSTDCPGFDGLYNFCQISAGGSIDAAHLIINQEAEIAINWGGGLHHAKKQEASGFCYINDIVLCILELLKFYPRVMYIDIDVHHGDGVEEAFFLSNRVLTLSFHQYGDDFFPGSGNVDSHGEGIGKYHAINVPLKPGITDNVYQQTFKRISQATIEKFRPDVIILQGGADSIAHDKLGSFNLSTKGRGECVKFIQDFGLPVIKLGGGGYNVPNVARCWANETSVTLGIEQEQQLLIPNTDMYYDQYQPDHKFHVFPKNNLENKNKPEQINRTEAKILEYLREVESAPGFQFHYVPDSYKIDEDEKFMQDDDEDIRYQYGSKAVDPEILEAEAMSKIRKKVNRAQNI
ncbi:hypothetical protein PPERSA_04873 [Pseudocohnilembus persalinus]|uniref:Histone deacetylase n=1 Tax=Pseudocohnilembus persalinus TaxID=266149 RepID=A0A0V0QJB6_PSEPJ|nr:hypothetical protein PPERSA_04873 [Pseudocohnilembus persalinus]|eukprot:KRX02251.1 hypothetical protein PPERSA_04873 [Pseudocohnilembus persalinus]